MKIKTLFILENDSRNRVSKWVFLSDNRKCFRYDSEGILTEINYKKGMKICKRLCINNMKSKMYHMEGNFLDDVLENNKTDELLNTLRDGGKIILGVH